MSDLAAVLFGLGIGLLVGLPALVVYCHDIARSVRRLLKMSGEREAPGGADHLMEASGDRTEGFSPAIAVVGVGTGTLTALYGVLFGGAVFIASGIFVALSACVACVASKTVKG